MTHFYDDDVKKALFKLSPEEKVAIEDMKFGEIKEGYALDYLSRRAS